MLRTRVGYAGGTQKNPTYHSLGDHAETTQIDFDPARISYEELLKVFWENHDPTFPAFSRQYMSAIFYHDEEQERSAFGSRDKEAAELKKKIFTEIIPFNEFYLAEDYHQKYALQHNPELMSEFRSMYPSVKEIISSTAAARVNGYLSGYGNLKVLQAEVDGYGISESAKTQLFNLVKDSHRICCKR